MNIRPLVATIGAFVVLGASPVSADGPDVTNDPLKPTVRIRAVKTLPALGVGAALGGTVKQASIRNFVFVQCPVDAEVGTYGCRDTSDDDDDGRDLTEGDVLRAVREIGLPRLSVSIQPGERTLVNADTIFSASPVPFDHSVMLLGFDVDLVATPVSYTWHHGDGTSRSTSEPGRPYPAFDITHRYRKAADVVRPSVDVTYQVRYRVDGGAWATISQTITAPGPAAELEVREAVPVLTKP